MVCDNPPVVLITMGEPAGVGPELCVKFLSNEHFKDFVPWVIGDADVLRSAARAVGVTCDLPVRALTAGGDLGQLEAGDRQRPLLLHLPVAGFDGLQVMPGRFNRHSGRASFGYVQAATRAALAGYVAAICTGPIQKEAWHLAGIDYPGHTELLAKMTSADRTCMMLTSDEITCSLVTTHVGLRDVAELLSVESIVGTIELSAAALRARLGRAPRFSVCGLNPHAGEAGQFGHGEEERIIVPAIEQARRLGHQLQGPLAPDTAFLPFRRAQTDGYICMYHDQGLIPLKTLAFDQAVNITLGLPIVRTSVDHGTALDIAWQGRANLSSFRLAVQRAAELAVSS